ncbi:hypothetical protein ANCCAN_02758 [Ancylostoma caninum]|uniref:Uncharacterized protein n=1 Tax=Ancylostoma caninum TaxID=29170 RepID=A0A368H6D0_ANCCA|nr:hypothetical protein ANCCAN_02758 [Ancylostoma caninum]
MSPRFFRSLLLSFCMTVYVATQAVNYEKPNRSSTEEELPESFTIPVNEADYRNRARTAREHAIVPKYKRTLHKSFGITSQFIRRTPENSRNVTGRSLMSLLLI